MPLDNPLFDVQDNVVYFKESGTNRSMEKRTYAGGTWSLIDNGGTPNDNLDDSIIAFGSITYLTLFLDYTNFQNTGRGVVTLDPGTTFYNDLVGVFGTSSLNMTVHSLQTPVSEDSPSAAPTIEKYAVFDSSVSLAPSQP